MPSARCQRSNAARAASTSAIAVICKIPRATSAIRILQQLGGSFGIAILTVVLQRELVIHVHDAASLAAAYGHTFWWALAFIVLAAVPALMLPGSLAGRRPEASPAAA